MGFKDFDSAVKAKLKDAGIALNENPERFDNWLDNPWNMEGLIALNDECQKDFEAIDKTGYLGLSDVSQLKEIEKKATEIRAKYNSQSIALYSQSIPDFIKRLQNECDSYSSDSSGNNEQKSASCKNLSTLKRKAVDLFRIEDTPGYKKAAEAFVKENMPESKPKSDVFICCWYVGGI